MNNLLYGILILLIISYAFLHWRMVQYLKEVKFQLKKVEIIEEMFIKLLAIFKAKSTGDEE